MIIIDYRQRYDYLPTASASKRKKKPVWHHKPLRVLHLYNCAQEKHSNPSAQVEVYVHCFFRIITQSQYLVYLKFVTLPKTTARQSAYNMDATKNIYPVFDKMADRSAHEALLGQRGVMLWFTGLSGSGKTTLALALERELLQRGRLCRLLDGDNIRTGLNSNLGFSAEDRRENIRRIAEVGKLFVDTGIITIAAFISPTQAMRAMAEEIIGAEHFKEIYISTPLEVCESRDVKGLYARARRGEIPNFTGISAPFEAPPHPALSLDTSRLDFSTCLQRLLDLACPTTTAKDTISGKP